MRGRSGLDHPWNGRARPDRPRAIIARFLLLLLQRKKVGFVFDLGEVLGPIFSGEGDAEGQLFAVELVDTFGGLALGFLSAPKTAAWVK